MFECLTSLMVANPLIAPFLEGAPGGREHMQNGLLIAVDISKFGDVGDYAREVDRLAEAIKVPAPRRRHGRNPGARRTRRPGTEQRKADGLRPTARETAGRGSIETRRSFARNQVIGKVESCLLTGASQFLRTRSVPEVRPVRDRRRSVRERR